LWFTFFIYILSLLSFCLSGLQIWKIVRWKSINIEDRENSNSVQRNKDLLQPFSVSQRIVLFIPNWLDLSMRCSFGHLCLFSFLFDLYLSFLLWQEFLLPLSLTATNNLVWQLMYFLLPEDCKIVCTILYDLRKCCLKHFNVLREWGMLVLFALQNHLLTYTCEKFYLSHRARNDRYTRLREYQFPSSTNQLSLPFSRKWLFYS